MKRLFASIVMAGLTPLLAIRAADPPAGVLIPTTPSIPAPVLERGGIVLPASGASRVVPPIRERVANPFTRPSSTPASLPLPTGYQTQAAMPAANGGAGGCAANDCTTAKPRGACLKRIKAWLCFCPTTGDALPLFNPAPYIGPIAGTFSCTSANGCATGACGSGQNCQSGNCCTSTTGTSASGSRQPRLQHSGKGATRGESCTSCENGKGGDTHRGSFLTRLGNLVPFRGSRGGCVPPSENAFPGYYFAQSQSPAIAALMNPGSIPAQPPSGYINYPSLNDLSKPLSASDRTNEAQRPGATAESSPASLRAGAMALPSVEQSKPRSVRWASWWPR